MLALADANTHIIPFAGMTQPLLSIIVVKGGGLDPLAGIRTLEACDGGIRFGRHAWRQEMESSRCLGYFYT